MISPVIQRTFLAILFLYGQTYSFSSAVAQASESTTSDNAVTHFLDPDTLLPDDEPLFDFSRGMHAPDENPAAQELFDDRLQADSPLDESGLAMDTAGDDGDESEENEVAPPALQAPRQRTIKEINISGNARTSRAAILNYVPYKVGEVFDPNKTSQLIRHLYFGLNRFRNVTLKGQLVGDDGIILHVVVEEKQPVKDVLFEGNKALTTKEIRGKIDFDFPAIDEEELNGYIGKIKRLYVEKGHQSVDITTEMVVDDDDKATITFKVDEGKKSAIRRIKFEGNEHLNDKQLRKALFSREEWILSMLDKSGVYQPERLEGDKYMIEQLYQNSGFINGKVINIDIDKEPDGTHMNITFQIEEGDCFHFGKIEAPGNDILPQEVLLQFIPMRPGMPYSRERVANSIKALEHVWGNMGYIFAHIDPSIQPNEETKTVDVSFSSDIGKCISLNKITVKGNRKTRDKIIRRRLALEEGGLLTSNQMDSSKQSVEALGYFEPRDGVNWKMRRIDDELADLDLIVHETKTGHANIQLGIGGAGVDLRSPTSGFNVKGSVSDTNLFGSGMRFNLESSWARREQTLMFHLSQPWLFDKPITGALDIYHRRPTYEDLRNIEPSTINEKLTGGALTAGFITRSSRIPLFHNVQISTALGVDSLRYERRPRAQIIFSRDRRDYDIYQCILDRHFCPGDFAWLGATITQDKRNHPMFPSRGLQWQIATKVAIKTLGSTISFHTTTFDVNWFTPLIGERDLILRLHAFLGATGPIGNCSVPYRELFHIGGDRSVRGFLFGQIGPKLFGDSIGARKAFFVNVELVFPITPDMSMRGLVFYDGGAGWDPPYSCMIPQNKLTGDRFDYRHSVGFGIRLFNPVPVRIDWGFKIDPRKDKLNPERNESSHEVHFGMNYDW